MMTRRSCLRTATVFAALLFLSGSAPMAQAPIVASDPWMREPMARAEQTAVFVVLENRTPEKRQLVSATSTVADRVELHTMSTENGMMRMMPVKAIDVPANGKAELRPGSFHIMLFGLKERPASGASVDLTLTFDNGQTVPIKAVVRKPEGMR
ncbi:MAG: copper chaperone PCu(A)C [Vicinamibacterales bacterium]